MCAIHRSRLVRLIRRTDDDWAVATLAELLGYTENATFFRNRAQTSPFSIYNNATGFMEARNANGSWAGQDEGWTEGDMWAYTFDVVHDIPGLIAAKGGNASFVAFLDADRKSTRLNSSHSGESRMPSSA